MENDFRLITPILVLQFSANIFLSTVTYYVVIFLDNQSIEQADFFSHVFAMVCLCFKEKNLPNLFTSFHIYHNT